MYNYSGFSNNLYSFCNSNKHAAHKHPSYNSLTYCVSLSVNCTFAHWHLVNEFALHSNADWQRSQRTISCLECVIIIKNKKGSREIFPTSKLKQKPHLFYAEQVTQPSSIEQLGPAGISSAICCTCSGITGSIFFPPWFSTVNLTACDAACVRR